MKLSPPDVQKFLSDHLQAEINSVQPVGQGEWSQAFFFTVCGRDKVIRFSQIDEDFRLDAFAATFSSPRLPVPPIEEIGQAFGGYFAISPKAEGKMIDHLPAAEMRQAVPALMDLLDALRMVDTSGTTGYGGIDTSGNGTSRSWKEFLNHLSTDPPNPRTVGWRENLARDKEANRIFHEASQRLAETAAVCPESRHLVHNDLLHYNLIIRDGKVAAVIDWGCALYGDFLYDLAMFTTWQFYYPAMQGIDFVEEVKRYFGQKEIELPNLEQRLHCYQLYLLLDSLAYNAFKQNQEHLDLTVQRLHLLLKI